MDALSLFQTQLNSHKNKLSKLLKESGRDIKWTVFESMVLNAVRENDKLLACDRGTMLGAVYSCAEIGLLPNTPHNFCYILPHYRSYRENGAYKSIMEARYITGYQGWIEIMSSTDRVTDITSEIVYENDAFKEVKGLKPDLIHEPADGDRGERSKVYAVAWIKDHPNPHFVVIDKSEIEILKNKAVEADKYSLWANEDKDPFGWMWRKTAIKQLAKQLPKSKPVMLAIHRDNLVDSGEGSFTFKDGRVYELRNEAAMEKKSREKQSKRASEINKGLKRLIDKDGQTSLFK